MFYFDNIQNKELIDYINNLIDKKNYEEALQICNKDEYKNSSEVKCQIIRILKKQNKLNQALELCNEYENDKNFIFQKIDILIKKNQLNEALELCELYSCDEYFESQKITILIRKSRFDEAIEICDKYPESIFIQSQKITILIKQNRLEEALVICNNFLNEEGIQSQKITILIKQNKLYSALEVCDRFPNYKFIQCQKVTILMMLNKLEEALEICKRKEYEDDKYFIKKIRRIESKKSEKCKEDSKDNFSIDTSHDVLVKIYSGDITLDEIKEDDEWKKFILTAAYYEKNNKQKGIELIKKYKNNEDLSNEQIKVLNILYNRLIIKKTMIFDLTIYSQYLGIQTKKENKIVIESNLLIKDLFKEQVLEISKYLYVKMQGVKTQAKAIKAWDRFEVLINKPVTDKESLKRMIELLKRIEKSDEIEINLNEKKYAKYINT